MSLPPLIVRAALDRVLSEIKPPQDEYDDWYENTLEHRRERHPFDNYRIISHWLENGSHATLATEQMFDALEEAETTITEMLKHQSRKPEDEDSIHQTLAKIREAMYKAQFS